MRLIPPMIRSGLNSHPTGTIFQSLCHFYRSIRGAERKSSVTGIAKSSAGSILGDAIDLGKTGNPLFYLLQGRGTQVVHTGLARDLRDLQSVTALEDDFLDVFQHRHDLVDTYAALIPLIAGIAANRLVHFQAGIDF